MNKKFTVERARKLMVVAHAIAKLSKDKGAQVGAVIIGADGEGGPWGYNGAVRGCNADEDGRMDIRPEKYKWAEHAERNAIYAAARAGFITKGCTLVCTHPPCMDCARAIVQAGIKQVFTDTPDAGFMDRWHSDILLSNALFTETNLEYHWI